MVEDRHSYWTSHRSDFVFSPVKTPAPTDEQVEAMAREGIAEHAVDYEAYLETLTAEELAEHMRALRPRKPSNPDSPSPNPPDR